MPQETVRHRSRPPGPSFFDAAIALVRARRDPLEFARGLVEEYGDVVSYRVGPYTGYLLRHPDHIRRVLSDRHQNYGKNNVNYEELKPVLGAGLITSEGDDWIRARRQLQILFRRRSIDALGPLISRVTSDVLAQWDESVGRGEPIDVFQDLSIITMRVVGKLLLDIDLGARAGSIAENFDIINEDVAYRFRNPFCAPRWAPTRRNRNFRKALNDLESQICELIRTSRRESTSRDNLVDLLDDSRQLSKRGEMPDRQVRDHAVTLILAGYETTSALLGWTWFLLATHPHWTSILRRELEQQLDAPAVRIEDLCRLAKTRAVLLEAMRLYPPVWVISRKAVSDDEIGGYHVPGDTIVTLSMHLLHRHPSFWDEPDTFKPERFLARPVDERHPFSYLPFGAGPRQCIGSHLAMVEAMLVLPQIIGRYDPKIPPDTRSRPDPMVTLRPSMSVLATPRTA